MKNTLLLTIILLLVGCITPGKVSTFLEKPKNKPEADVIIQQYLSANELLAAAFCARTYPVKEKISVKVDTVTLTKEIPGKVMDCPETVDKETGKVYIPKVVCPPTLQYITTIKQLKESVQENSALIEAGELLLTAQKDSTAKYKAEKAVALQELDSVKSSRDLSYILNAILIVAFAGLLFLLFRR